jgi:hypothetical protein
MLTESSGFLKGPFPIMLLCGLQTAKSGLEEARHVGWSQG